MTNQFSLGFPLKTIFVTRLHFSMMSAYVAFCFASSKEMLLVKSELVPQPAMNVSTTNDFFCKSLKRNKNAFLVAVYTVVRTHCVFSQKIVTVGNIFLHVKMSNLILFSPI